MCFVLNDQYFPLEKDPLIKRPLFGKGFSFCLVFCRRWCKRVAYRKRCLQGKTGPTQRAFDLKDHGHPFAAVGLVTNQGDAGSIIYSYFKVCILAATVACEPEHNTVLMYGKAVQSGDGWFRVGLHCKQEQAG